MPRLCRPTGKISIVKFCRSSQDNEVPENEETRMLKIFESKMNEDSMIEANNQQLNEYRDQLKYKEELIRQFEEKNQILAERVEQVSQEKSLIQEQYDSIHKNNSLLEKEKENESTIVLTQKVEYLQEEVQEISSQKHKKEVECEDLIQQLNDKEDII